MIKKLKGGPYFLFYKRIDTRKFSDEKNVRVWKMLMPSLWKKKTFFIVKMF